MTQYQNSTSNLRVPAAAVGTASKRNTTEGAEGEKLMTDSGLRSACDSSAIRRVMAPEWRHPGQAEHSPAEALEQIPALVVLERITVPAVATDKNGMVLLANTAFAAMLGHTQEAIEHLTFQQNFCHHAACLATTGEGTRSAALVKLAHRDGFTVFARVSRSTVKHNDDELTMVFFEDLTEELWMYKP